MQSVQKNIINNNVNIKKHKKSSKITYNKFNLLNKIDKENNKYININLLDNIIYKKDDIINCNCNIHSDFTLTIKQLLKRKYLCEKCKQISINNKNIQNGINRRKNNFIQNAITQHGNQYDYSKVDLNGKLKKVEIICSKHGPFWIMPSLHTRGEGCNLCNKTQLNAERRLGVLLSEFINIINNKYNKTFKLYSQWHSILKRQSLDYYITDGKIQIGIEYHGNQHFDKNYYNQYFKDYRHTFEHLIGIRY